MDVDSRAREFPKNVNAPRPHAVLLLGPTGSGKTPLGQRLEALGWSGRRCVHFDFGDHLRRVAAQDDPQFSVSPDDVRFIRRLLESGALLEDKDFPLAERIVSSFLKRHQVGQDKLVVLNGLPRHIGQAMAMAEIVDVKMVVCLDCSPETILDRIAANIGGDRSHRTDDDVSAIEHKLAIYSQRTTALIDHYQAIGAKVVRVEVTAHMTPEQMWRTLAPAP
jgi:adenylate kinase family enzyme